MAYRQRCAYCQEVLGQQGDTLTQVRAALAQEQLAGSQEKAAAEERAQCLQVLTVLSLLFALSC